MMNCDSGAVRKCSHWLTYLIDQSVAWPAIYTYGQVSVSP